MHQPEQTYTYELAPKSFVFPVPEDLLLAVFLDYLLLTLVQITTAERRGVYFVGKSQCVGHLTELIAKGRGLELLDNAEVAPE